MKRERSEKGTMSGLKNVISKKLGFGCMRLPVINGDVKEIDDGRFCAMIDSYLEQGFTYFDTAYPYHEEKSEEAVRRCLVNRYDREAFLLATKMPVWLVKETADYERLFETQRRRCGVDYFDFYLLHAMNRKRLADTEEKGGFAFVEQKKAEGKIRHIGFSFHDTAEVLDDFLSRHPEMEFVQLQINYYDWESEHVQSRKCYETAVRHGVPVIVMEPVKGGILAAMAEKPAAILKRLDDKASLASFAIRYAASLENVIVVLSGMSNEEQLEDNTSYMRDFKPLSREERQVLREVVEELEKLPTIACTQCRYCVEGCPKHIPIPETFQAYNSAVQFGLNDITRGNYERAVADHGRAEDCIKCGNCEGQCPQHLAIRDWLAKTARAFQA